MYLLVEDIAWEGGTLKGIYTTLLKAKKGAVKNFPKIEFIQDKKDKNYWWSKQKHHNLHIQRVKIDVALDISI